MVIPTSAHAAFHKAAEFLGVRAVLVDVDPRTLRADPAAMAGAVDDTTVLVVASAPSYAHGVVDPVARDRGAGRRARHPLPRRRLHRRLGAAPPRRRPPWTFAVEGVTSISVDLHKYAYTPKGVSVLLHRTPALRRGHFFASANWPGYTMLNSTMQSTRSGGPLAAAWAVTQRIGVVGYADLARQAREATLAVATAVDGIRGLSVLAPPDSTLVALVADELVRRLHRRRRDARARLVRAAAAVVRRRAAHAAPHPVGGDRSRRCPSWSWPCASRWMPRAPRARSRVDPGLAGLLGSIDPATLDDAGFAGLLAAAGLAGSDGTLALPRRMAPVNALLDACPPPLREALLLGVLDRLSRPTRLTPGRHRAHRSQSAPTACPRPARVLAGPDPAPQPEGRRWHPRPPTPPCRTRSGRTRRRCSSRPSATTSTRRWPGCPSARRSSTARPASG